ncbi:MAG: capsid protein [Firmicutes bacterium]|nr:capsid protein [Bacillota bacterium]
MADQMNYAEEYARDLANAYPQVLHFAALRNTENDDRYTFLDAKTIHIPHLSTTGRTNASRDEITGFSRNFENEWEDKTLTFHREWSTLVHPRDIDETNQAATIANITKTFNETEKFPEMDNYLVSKLHSDWVEAGGEDVTEEITTQNVLTVFDDMMEGMDEEDVPATGRLLYVNPRISKLLKNTKEIGRSLSVDGKSDREIDRLIARLDEVVIEKVPSKHMKTAYDFTIGSKVGASAKQIGMFMVHPSVVITPDAYDFVGLSAPTAQSKGKWLYYEESYGDVFILNKRIAGLKFAVESGGLGG